MVRKSTRIRYRLSKDVSSPCWYPGKTLRWYPGLSDDVVLLAIVRTLAISGFWADLSWTTFLKFHSFTTWGSTIRNQGWKWGNHQGIRQERQRLSLRWEQRRWWEKLDFRPYSVFGRWGWMDFLSDRLIGCEMWQEAKIQGSLWGLGPEQLLRMGSPQLSHRRLGVRDAVRGDEKVRSPPYLLSSFGFYGF